MQTGQEELDGLSRSERRALVRLLVRATAAAGGPDDPGLAALVADAPLHALPAGAALHRVSGSVRRALDQVDGVPDDVTETLQAIERFAAMRHLTFVGALGTIARALDTADVPWVVMKGPVLAGTLYPGIGDRSYADLDLLVGRQDFPTAMAILEDLGYGHAIHDWARAEEMLAGQVSMATSAVSIDLHWHLHYSTEDRRPYALDPEGMIERSRRVDVSGLLVPTLDQVDTVITLAFHAARSDGHRLVWLKDLERSITVGEPDPDELVRRARVARCAAPVGLMLARTRNVLGAPVPKPVVDALAPRGVLLVDRAASALVDPIQLHERGTLTRAATRSVRSSLWSSVSDIPTRSLRWVRHRGNPEFPNETDDPVEKASYLRAVTTSAR